MYVLIMLCISKHHTSLGIAHLISLSVYYLPMAFILLYLHVLLNCVSSPSIVGQLQHNTPSQLMVVLLKKALLCMYLRKSCVHPQFLTIQQATQGFQDYHSNYVLIKYMAEIFSVNYR